MLRRVRATASVIWRFARRRSVWGSLVGLTAIRVRGELEFADYGQIVAH